MFASSVSNICNACDWPALLVWQLCHLPGWLVQAWDQPFADQSFLKINQTMYIKMSQISMYIKICWLFFFDFLSLDLAQRLFENTGSLCSFCQAERYFSVSCLHCFWITYFLFSVLLNGIWTFTCTPVELEKEQGCLKSLFI